jgi:hypothetical protein
VGGGSGLPPGVWERTLAQLEPQEASAEQLDEHARAVQATDPVTAASDRMTAQMFRQTIDQAAASDDQIADQYAASDPRTAATNRELARRIREHFGERRARFAASHPVPAAMPLPPQPPVPTPPQPPPQPPAPTPPTPTPTSVSLGVAGRWSGDGWGNIVINSDGTGSYSDTFGTGPGRLQLRRVADGSYDGTWGESSQRHGTLMVVLSADGRQLNGTWTPDPQSTIGSMVGGAVNWVSQQ